MTPHFNCPSSTNSRREPRSGLQKDPAQTDPVEVLPQVVRAEDARNLDELVFVARAVEQGVAVEDLREGEGAVESAKVSESRTGHQ